MQAWLSKLTGRPAVKNLEVELEGVEKKLARFREAQTPAQNYAETIDAAAKAFIASPSPEKCRAWIAAESLRLGAHEVSQRTRDICVGLRDELLKDLVEQIRGAIDELLAGLAEQKAKVTADDAAKSAEYGETVTSDAVLSALDKKIRALEEARGWVDSDLARSVSAIRSVLS